MCEFPGSETIGLLKAEQRLAPQASSRHTYAEVELLLGRIRSGCRSQQTSPRRAEKETNGQGQLKPPDRGRLAPPLRRFETVVL